MWPSLDADCIVRVQMVLACLRVSPDYVAAVVRPHSYDPHLSTSTALYPALAPGPLQVSQYTAKCKYISVFVTASRQLFRH